MPDRLSASAARVLIAARDEARALDHTWLGTEHILIGAAVAQGLARDVLERAGFTAPKLRVGLESLYARGSRPSRSKLAPTERARAALDAAARAARDLGRPWIGPEHILFGLLADGQGAACAIVKVLGGSTGELRGVLLDSMRSKTFQEALDTFFERAERELPSRAPRLAPIPVARLVDGPLYACPLGHGPMEKLEEGPLVVGVCAECRGTFVPGGKMHDVVQAFLREGSP